jgi:hypothetical protein
MVMAWCSTLDSKNHLMLFKENAAFLQLSSIERTTTFWTCMFSSKSDHAIKGNLYLNGTKYENISGTIHLDNHDYSLHYIIFDKNHSDLISFDATLSLVDYQNTMFGYEPIVKI